MRLTRYFLLRFARCQPIGPQCRRRDRARFQMWQDEARVIGASGRAVGLATRR